MPPAEGIGGHCCRPRGYQRHGARPPPKRAMAARTSTRAARARQPERADAELPPQPQPQPTPLLPRRSHRHASVPPPSCRAAPTPTPPARHAASRRRPATSRRRARDPAGGRIRLRRGSASRIAAAATSDRWWRIRRRPAHVAPGSRQKEGSVAAFPRAAAAARRREAVGEGRRLGFSPRAAARATQDRRFFPLPPKKKRKGFEVQ